MLSRIGVLLCTCNRKLESINFDKVSSYLRNCKGVQAVKVNHDICKQPFIIRELITSEGLDGLVIGACSLYDALFRDESEGGGLNPLLLEVVNLKEQFAGTYADHEKTTLKAMLLIRGSVEKMKYMEAAAHVAPQTIPSDERVTRRALFRSIPKFLKVYRPTPIVEGWLCAGPKACKFCIDACPYNALTVGEGGIIVDKVKCKLCGVCSTVCPLGAIQIPTHTDEQLEAQIKGMLLDMETGLDRRVLVFTCDESSYPAINAASDVGAKLPVEALIVRLPNLGVLSEITILTAFALGADGVILCGCLDCNCPHPNSLSSAKQKFAIVKTLLPTFNIDPSRISLLQVHRDNPQAFIELLAKFVDKIKAIDPNPLQLTFTGDNRRVKFINLIKALADKTSVALGSVEWTAPCYFADIFIDQEKCTACELCSSCCPTKALEIRKDEKAISLAFDYKDCIGCGLCESTCPEKAVNLKRVFDVSRLLEDKPRTLVTQGLVACSNCGKPFATINKLKKIKEIHRRSGITSEPATLRLCQACRRNNILPVMYPTKEVRR